MSEKPQTILSISLRLTSQEYKKFMELRALNKLSTPDLVKQALWVYDQYVSGKLMETKSE